MSPHENTIIITFLQLAFPRGWTMEHCPSWSTHLTIHSIVFNCYTTILPCLILLFCSLFQNRPCNMSPCNSTNFTRTVSLRIRTINLHIALLLCKLKTIPQPLTVLYNGPGMLPNGCHPVLRSRTNNNKRFSGLKIMALQEYPSFYSINLVLNLKSY